MFSSSSTASVEGESDGDGNVDLQEKRASGYGNEARRPEKQLHCQMKVEMDNLRMNYSWNQVKWFLADLLRIPLRIARGCLCMYGDKSKFCTLSLNVYGVDQLDAL